MTLLRYNDPGQSYKYSAIMNSLTGLLRIASRAAYSTSILIVAKVSVRANRILLRLGNIDEQNTPYGRWMGRVVCDMLQLS